MMALDPQIFPKLLAIWRSGIIKDYPARLLDPDPFFTTSLRPPIYSESGDQHADSR